MTQRPPKRSDVELTRQLLVVGRNVGAPPADCLPRTLERMEAAVAAGLLATGTSIGVASAVLPTETSASVVTNSFGVNSVAGLTGTVKPLVGLLATKGFLAGLLVGLLGGGAVVGMAYHPSNTSVSNRNETPRKVQSREVNPASSASAIALPNGFLQSPPTNRVKPPAEYSPQEEPPLSPELVRKWSKLPPNQRPESILSPELARELATLDEAQAALERGSPSAALRTLDRYQVAFPKGQLTPEAELLRTRANSALQPNISATSIDEKRTIK